MSFPLAVIRGERAIMKRLRELKPQRRAVRLLTDIEKLNVAEAAEMVGVARSTIYRSPEFKRLRQLTARGPARGFKDKKGNLEAIDDSEG